MKHKTFHMVLLAMPMVLGALSLLSFVLYYYSANHPPYAFTKVIAAGPVLALAGLVILYYEKESEGTSRPVGKRVGGMRFGLCDMRSSAGAAGSHCCGHAPGGLAVRRSR